MMKVIFTAFTILISIPCLAEINCSNATADLQYQNTGAGEGWPNPKCHTNGTETITQKGLVIYSAPNYVNCPNAPENPVSFSGYSLISTSGNAALISLPTGAVATFFTQTLTFNPASGSATVTDVLICKSIAAPRG